MRKFLKRTLAIVIALMLVLSVPMLTGLDAYAATTNTIMFNANGGSGGPSYQNYEADTFFTLTSSIPSRTGYTFNGWITTPTPGAVNVVYQPGSSQYSMGNVTLYAYWKANEYTVKYNSNGGSGSMSSTSHVYGEYKSLRSNSFTKSGYNFIGWSTYSGASSATYSDGQSVKNLTATNGGTVTLYAVWSAKSTYTITYNANGGSGAPSSQTKTEGSSIYLSSQEPEKTYNLYYDANGGSLSIGFKVLFCDFLRWNTSSYGSGTSWYPGERYSSDSNLYLYAQWPNPTAGTLPTPTRTGYNFDGWYTSRSGGTRVTSSSSISSSTTIYAHWSEVVKEDVYNLGEETYSFDNFGDYDSAGGHCFGMSVTSSAYFMGELDVSDIGLSSSDELYTVTLNENVKKPICHYQAIQGSKRNNAIVSGGRGFTTYYDDINLDWNDVVSYVKNHSYDNKGTLQVINYVNSEGGHAMNFLYYKNVDGQDRVYVYDNNFPDTETYFYKDSSGKIRQAPYSTFKSPLDCIGLVDVKQYIKNTEGFDFTHAIYAYEDEISIEGVTGYPMLGENDGRVKYMYEVPESTNQVKIVPLVDDAEFSYLNEDYNFGKIDDTTVGVFNLASVGADGDTQAPGLTITNEPEEQSFFDFIINFFIMIFSLILLPFNFLF